MCVGVTPHRTFARQQPAVLEADGMHTLLLGLHVLLAAFEQQRGHRQLGGVKAFDLVWRRNEEEVRE